MGFSVVLLTVSLRCARELERRDRPLEEKHVRQQASILGNMALHGLLGERAAPGEGEGGRRQSRAFVELGAGRGYLTQLLCDCFGAREAVLVERRSYKFKVSTWGLAESQEDPGQVKALVLLRCSRGPCAHYTP